MSKLFPECPLSNHTNCKYLGTKLCAMYRKDGKCQKNKNNAGKPRYPKERPIEYPAEVNPLRMVKKRGSAI